MANDFEKSKKALEFVAQEMSEEKKPKKEVSHSDIEPGLRTYASDIAEMMRREKGSIVKIALAEQQRRDDFQKRRDPTSTRNIVVMLLGIALIVGGVMIFVYSIIGRGKPIAVTNYSIDLPSFFFTESQVHIDMTDLNRTELIKAIQNEVSSDNLSINTIKNIFISYHFNDNLIQTPSIAFLQKLGIDIPENLFSNLESNFMTGVYRGENGGELFLVFHVKDFNQSFTAMREWEGTLLSEMVRLFAIDTSVYGKEIFNKNFVTTIVSNKEVRVLQSDTGETIFSYAFLDPKTLLISTKGDSLNEILKRITLQSIR